MIKIATVYKGEGRIAIGKKTNEQKTAYNKITIGWQRTCDAAVHSAHTKIFRLKNRIRVCRLFLVTDFFSSIHVISVFHFIIIQTKVLQSIEWISSSL